MARPLPVLPRPCRNGAIAAVALIVGAVLSLAGCALFREVGLGGDDPHWQTARFKGVNSAQVLTMAQSATAHEYPAQKIDAYRGQFESGWIYGMFDPTRRQPLRQRVIVEAAPEDGIVVCRLRVQQEQNPASGSFQPKYDDTGWDKFDDDDRKAVLLMQRLLILMKDVAEIVPDPKAGDAKS
jgi:hypothetical protein